jgi:hypothetical protein
MKEIQEKIDWTAFDSKAEDRLKLEDKKPISGIGFCSIKPGTMEVEEKEKTDAGTVPTKKTVPTLVLGIDYKEEKPVKLEFVVTSKRLAHDIRTYYDEGMLFTRFFKIMRDGTGYETRYTLIALKDKPNAPSMSEPKGGEKSTEGTAKAVSSG